MNKPNKGLAAVLCALLTFLIILAAGFAMPSESEAAAGTVRRAPVAPQRSTTPSTFARGDGTEKTPYIIGNATQLLAFATSVNNGNAYADKYVKLGADIDLKDVVWAPIGFYDKHGGTRPFKGFFYGAGFTISNMGAGNDMRRPATSFFGALDGATVDRVSLQFVNVAGDSNVGGLVG